MFNKVSTVNTVNPFQINGVKIKYETRESKHQTILKKVEMFQSANTFSSLFFILKNETTTMVSQCRILGDQVTTCTYKVNTHVFT